MRLKVKYFPIWLIVEQAFGYQYPHSVVVDDDIWVLLSVNKEDIQITRIPLEELDKLPYYKYYGYE